MSKPIRVMLGNERFDCFRVSTGDGCDCYVVPGVGWVTLARATGIVVEMDPLSRNGGRTLEAIAAEIFRRGEPSAA